MIKMRIDSVFDQMIHNKKRNQKITENEKRVGYKNYCLHKCIFSLRITNLYECTNYKQTRYHNKLYLSRIRTFVFFRNS